MFYIVKPVHCGWVALAAAPPTGLGHTRTMFDNELGYPDVLTNGVSSIFLPLLSGFARKFRFTHPESGARMAEI